MVWREMSRVDRSLEALGNTHFPVVGRFFFGCCFCRGLAIRGRLVRVGGDVWDGVARGRLVSYEGGRAAWFARGITRFCAEAGIRRRDGFVHDSVGY